MKKFTPENLKKSLFMVLLSVGIFLVLIAAASQFAEMETLTAHLKTISSDMWFILFGAAILNYISRGARWHFFAEHLNMGVPIHRMALYYVSGFALITTPGKIGTALRIWFLKQCHGYAYSRTGSLMVMDQITDLFAMVILAIVGLFAFHYIGISLFVAIGFLVVSLFLLYKPKLILWLLDKINAVIRQPKIINALKSIIEHVNYLLTPSLLSFTTFLSVIGWGVTSFSFYLLLQHLGADISLLSCLFILSCAWLLGALSMMPGGLGSGEVIMVGLLISVDVPTDIAIVSTAVIRAVTIWFAVAIGFLILPFGLKTAKKAE